jgi:hypothetical protein
MRLSIFYISDFEFQSPAFIIKFSYSCLLTSISLISIILVFNSIQYISFSIGDTLTKTTQIYQLHPFMV